MGKSAAANRLFRALGRPHHRLIHGTFADLKDTWLVFQTERQRAYCKRVHLGATILVTLIHDRKCDFARLACAKFHQHTKAAKRMVKYDKSVVEAAQQLRVGGQLFRTTLRSLEMSQQEWALRTWCLAIARTVPLETKELIESTTDFNRQLVDRCQRLHFEGLAHSLVLF